MQGVVVMFDREKGYGFIRSEGLSQDVFVHIHAIRREQSLVPGQEVDFEIEKTDKGLSAVRVIPGKKRVSPYALYGMAALLFTFVSTAYLSMRGLNFWFAYLLSINLWTFLFYGYDKWIAGSSFLRVPEWILHAMAFGGGSPLALASQKVFHHKTIKRSFQFVYWAIVTLQVVLALAILFF
jgi:cold shock CspA family protein/uncharacterized membrane protein YsdA (DUF1294 family)